MTTSVKKSQIITAAIKLWRDAHNISKVSLDEIAREAGVSPTTVYNNFGTRDGLVQAVIRQLTDEVMDQMQQVLHSDLPFPLKMQRMVSIKLNTVSGMQTEIIEKIWTDPASREYVENITEKQAIPLMKSVIEQGKKGGYIHPDIPVEMILLYFNILKDGGEANKTEMARAAANPGAIMALARLMYFGIFQKEFDLNTGKPIENKES